MSETSKSPQFESQRLEIQSPKSDTLSLYGLGERPPVLHTDL